MPRKGSHLLGDSGQCLEMPVLEFRVLLRVLQIQCMGELWPSWELPESWPPRSRKKPGSPPLLPREQVD